MAISATRTTNITFTGDVSATQIIAAAVNAASPGQINLLTLAGGANTILVPSIAPVSVTIIPPAGNVQTLILKGVTGDTGIPIHPTDPTTLALAAGTTSFVITAGGTVTSMRFIWT